MAAAALLPLRVSWREWAGGLGDIGLLLPVALALMSVNGLGATAVLGGAGLAYIACALYFRVPLPVQPMKAFCATAVALQLDASTIALGAMMMAAALGMIGLSGAAQWLTDRCPVALVRGIQLSVALLLAKTAWNLAARGNWQGLPDIDPVLSLTVAAGVCALLVAGRRTRLPVALVVIAGGIVAGVMVSGAPAGVAFGPEPLHLFALHSDGLAVALSSLVLAQLPLTLGNSVVATTDVCREYYGDDARRVTPRALTLSMAIWNTLSAAFHGMPTCHGAGGATAHHALGARTGGGTALCGALLVALAVGAGAGVTSLAHTILPAALAGMLAYVAVEHAGLAARLPTAADTAVAGAVGVGTLITGNLGLGVAVGVMLLVARMGWRRRPAPTRA